MDEAGKADAGNVARGAEDALEVPDGFCAGVGSERACVVIEMGTDSVHTVWGRARRESRLRSLLRICL